jgi:amino acid transporter
LALAFGAMIGWGWVVLSGAWILRAGSLGAVTAFFIAGLVMLLIAAIYAELAAAMPKVGGEHEYSLRALGPSGSFVCTWAIVCAYVSVCCFEAVALTSALDYFQLDLKHFYLWTVAGYDVHLSWAMVGVIASIVLTIVNILGIKFSAVVQMVTTLFILFSGIVLVTGAGFAGSFDNVTPLFSAGVAGVLAVVTMVPFFFIGFDVIPQIAEEVNAPPRQIGVLTAVSVLMAIVFYCAVIFAVAMLADPRLLQESNLPTADATAKAWSGTGAAIMVLGGVAGIVTSWNAFIIGGSRAIFAMAKSGMLPRYLGVLHPRHRTPYAAILLIGILAGVAPLFGRNALVWIVNAGSFGAVVAYLFVAISFVRLRYTEPDMPRPFTLPYGLPIGWLGIACCLGLGTLYFPGSPAALAPVEWGIFASLAALGLALLVWAKLE